MSLLALFTDEEAEYRNEDPKVVDEGSPEELIPSYGMQGTDSAMTSRMIPPLI